jgi:hypothetical protein
MPLSRSILIGIAVTAIAGAAWAQDSGSLNARELFYKPAPVAPKPGSSVTAKRTTRKTVPQVSPDPNDSGNATPSTPSVPVTNVAYSALGLRYSVMKQQSDKSFAEVDADSVFHSGDKIRLQVETNGPAYLYLVMRGSSGKWQPLFPSPHIANGDNRVDKGKTYAIPPGNQGWFTFDENAGEEKLFLVLSRQPEPDFEKLIYSIGSTTPATNKPEPVKVMLAQNSAIGDEIVNRIRGQFASRDLVFEKVDESVSPGASNEKKEAAVYVVNPSTSPDSRLVVDMKLKHQ